MNSRAGGGQGGQQVLGKRMRGVRNRTFLLLDVCGWSVAPLVALVIRLDGLTGLGAYVDRAVLFTIIAVALQFLGMYMAGMYRRVWRYAGSDELFGITAALVLASLVSYALTLVVAPLLGPLGPESRSLPRSIPIINAFLAIAWSGGCRFAVKSLAARNGRSRRRGERALIIGAGSAGSVLSWQMRFDEALNLELVGFIDDDPTLHGQVIHGVPVLGGRSALVQAARNHRAGTAIIAMPSVEGRVVRQFRELCREADIRVLTVPGFPDLLHGGTSLTKIRELRIEDLLRRDPVKGDQAEADRLLAGETALVTGAGGSIGSELCRQIAHFGAAKIVILGHGENSIFAIDNELRRNYPALQVTAVIADIRDIARIDALFARFRPHAVFHAAAHKHVPLMELNPEEAITNNVGGTDAVLQAAERWGTQHFVLVSTDKAVDPSNVMGATKYFAERLVQAVAARTGRNFLVVRFGNVLGSRGSVVPTFQAQIAAGGPVYVTHPDVTRYFMTIPEAVHLVLHAATLGRASGEIFVLDMGMPVRIVDLAKDLIQLAGHEVGKDIQIEFTGLRPGERMFEHLFSKSERHHRTTHNKIFVAHNEERVSELELRALVEAAKAGDQVTLWRSLHRLAPAAAAGGARSVKPSFDGPGAGRALDEALRAVI